ncbi:hypothetical protein N0B44_02100 [Roseibacterium beibuensis]|uniref:Tat pathway signal sequence domain protein n=1 Tax=[Roseibacterium] beibuensis TaxID=1193142 RepID=A0ABP9KYV7_9RHOB|nr:hypothetical protein [Roseibacterium beibuensis]MCS6621695.1 hypothetical protein [Roseibacterium beibuensis]
MRTLCHLTLAFTLLSAPVLAQQADQPPRLGIELNRVDQLDGACRLTFMAENATGADLSTLSLETVLIDTAGQVDRLTLFDFGALPDGLPRVRQFDLGALDCAQLGRVLINGVAECSGGADCAGALGVSSRTDVEVIG